VSAAARTVGQRKKRIGEVISYALSHRTRVLILIVLNEGIFTPGQVAEIVDEPLKNVSNHMRELADCGSIELVKSVPRRNMMQHYYTAVQMPCYTEDDMEAMTPHQRDVTYGLVIQSLAAEMMAALWKGTLSSDPKTWLSWLWFNVDEEGREDIAAAVVGSVLGDPGGVSEPRRCVEGGDALDPRPAWWVSASEEVARAAVQGHKFVTSNPPLIEGVARGA